MTDATPRSALPLLAAAQSQKHVTHNEALLEMDALLCCTVLDRDLSGPPASSNDGDTYIVKATGTGAWAGQDGKIAYAIDGGWRFYAPFRGLIAYIADETKLVVYDGAAFVDYASVLSLQNVPLLGVNATADSTNKLAVKSAAVLFDNTGAGVQAKLNKNASADTASFLFQTAFSGRAEIGLTGDDNFHFKVSADGATFFESLIVNRNTGSVLLKHVDVSAAVTLGATHLGRMVRADATSGAFALTLPATADADDWVTLRKTDASANRVTVKDSGGADLAWLNAQYDEAMFAFWDGAWVPVRWTIAPLVQVFTASGTWTKPPLARAVNACAIGAGGGGGSGRRGAAGTARFGGGGGGAGVIGITLQPIPAANVGATETVTVGAGGSGGPAVTSDSTDGSVGTNGGNSSFGSHVRGVGGNAGAGGTSTSGTGGAAQASTIGSGTVGGNSSATGNAAGGGNGMIGAGGGGGGISTGNVSFAGGNGGNGSAARNGIIAGGAGGDATGTSGTNGTDIGNSYDYMGASGGGGGGASPSSNSGIGGNGGSPGGAGGGGGASLNGNNSGAGGFGGRGEVRVTTYF